MTITATESRWDYVGDGSTKAFPFSNRVFAATDLRVLLDGQRQTGGYTVSGIDVVAGGQVVFSVAPAAGAAVTLIRATPAKQLTAYPSNDRFPATAHERALDKLTVVAQQLETGLSRTLRLPDLEPGGDLTLPVAQERAGRLMTFNMAGTPTASDLTVAQLEGAAQAAWLDGQSVGDVTGYVGDGVATRFPTGHNLISKSSVTVVIGGVKQAPESYSIDGQDVVLAAPAPDGVKVDIRVIGVNVALADASGSQVIVPGTTTPRTLAQRAGDVVNVKDFVAKGDGVTDDTAAWQAAIAAAGPHGCMYAPMGNYLLDEVVIAVDGLRLQCDGIVVPKTPGRAAIKVTQASHLQISINSIDGGSANNGDGVPVASSNTLPYGIHLVNCTHSIFTINRLQFLGRGIYLHPVVNATRAADNQFNFGIIANCSAGIYMAAGGVGIDQTHCQNNVFRGGFIASCTVGIYKDPASVGALDFTTVEAAFDFNKVADIIDDAAPGSGARGKSKYTLVYDSSENPAVGNDYFQGSGRETALITRFKDNLPYIEASAFLARRAVEIGANRTTSGDAILDLTTRAGVDFDARVIRASGANGDLTIGNAGAGAINLVVNTSTPVLAGQSSGSVALPQGALEIGGLRTANGLSYIDFTSQAGADYNTRLIRDSGADGNFIIQHAGAGYVGVVGTLATNLLIPGTDNTYSLGNPVHRWTEVHATTGTIATSDARQKRNIVEADNAFCEALVSTLPAASFGRVDISYPAVTRTERRQVRLPVAREVTRVEVVDGVAIQRSATETVLEPQFEALPVVDVEGNPVWEMDKRGNVVMRDGQPVQATHLVPVMEDVVVETRPAYEKTNRRTHYGWIAQDLERAMTLAMGLDPDQPADVEAARLRFAGIIVAEDGSYGLRPDQLTAVLWQVVRSLLGRVSALEAK